MTETKSFVKGRKATTLLATAFAVLSATVLVIASGMQFLFNFQAQRGLVAEQQQLIARQAANTVASFIERKFAELDAAAKLGGRMGASAEEHQTSLNNLLGLDSAFRQVALLDLQGQELARTSRLSQLTAGQLDERVSRDMLLQVREGNQQITPVYIDDITSEPLVIVAVPVTNIFGDVQGMLLAEVNLKFMWDLVEGLEVGETGLAYVVNDQGDLLAFSDISRVLRGENVRNLGGVAEFVSNPHNPDMTAVDTFTGITGATVIGTYASLGTPDWAVMIELPITEAYQQIIRSGVLTLIGTLIMVGLAGGVGLYTARRLANPILDLTQIATRIAAGEMDLQVPLVGPAEVISLSEAFNYMTEQVSTLLQTVQARSEELEERSKELEASQRVTFAASERATPDEMLDLVVNLIRDQFDLYHAQVYLVDEEQQSAVLRQSTGYAGRQLLQRKHHIPLEATSLVTRAIHTGEPVLVDDVQAAPNFLANPLLPDTRSELVVPLKREGRVIGVLDAQDRTAGRFNPGTIALFQTMTDQVAILFENSELLQRVTDQTEALSVFTTQLRTAADIARRLGTILDPEQLLQEVVELIQSRYGLYHAHIYLLDEETNVLKLATGSGEVGRVLQERGHSIPMDAERSLVARAASTGSTILVVDTALEADFMPNPLLPQTRSELSLPLVVGNTLLGVLDLQDDQAGRFTEAERDTFGTLAGLIATAIQNARLFEEQQQAQEIIQESERRISTLMGNLPGMAYRMLNQPNWPAEFISEGSLELTGYAPEALIMNTGTITYGDLIHPEDQDMVWEVVQAALDKHQLFQVTYRIRSADGTLRWVWEQGTGVYNAEGEVLALEGFITDITDRKAAEAEIQKRASELQTVAEVSTAASTTLDPNALLAQVVELTKANFDLYHAHIYLLNEAGDTLVLAAGAGEAGAQMVTQGWQIAANSETSLVARAARTKEGFIVNDVQAAPDFLPNPLLPDTRAELAVPLIAGEQVLGVLDVQSDEVDHFTQQDVTIQTTLAGQIATAIENARLFQETRQVDRLKSEFLANMSHELRTPLNSIIGYVQLLLMDLEGEIPEDSYEDMKSVETNSQHLLNLINDVLDLARIEAGRMELHMENIDVSTLLDIVKSNNAGLFIDSPLTFSVEAEPDLSQICADQIRITQVLNNLISNAYKFTETGGITMRAYSMDEEVCIAIEDTGIGIAEEDMDTVFERFRQVDGSFTRRAEGTGLGLSITRLLVELHGGRLTVQSKLGEGSTFTVHLPAAA